MDQSDNEEFERAQKYGDAAFSQLKKHQVPAFPRNYELWYTYAAGFNRQLNKAINEKLKENGTLTSEDVSEVHALYVSQGRFGDQLDNIGTGLLDQMSTVMKAISEGTDASSLFSSSLEGVEKTLTGDLAEKELKEIVHELSEATKASIERNRNLEQQLNDSRSQIDELQKSLETVRYESLIDELTTLANRKHFDRSLAIAIEQAQDSDQPLTLLMTDIDRFKNFNDTFGHQTGDQVLRLVALSVKQNVKGQDIACRYGGEEFAVILPNTNLQQARTVSEHIREAVMGKELIKRSTGENLGRVTISIGCSLFASDDDAISLIERADSCLYLAKNAGRNNVKTETDLLDAAKHAKSA